MTRRFPSVLAACAALLLLTRCQAEQAPAPQQTQKSQQTESVDTSFLLKASRNGLAQVAFAQLAETKAADPKLRTLVATVLQDHATIDKQLAAFAQARGVALADVMDAEHQTSYRQLQSLNGVSFDRAYIERQMQNQTMAIQDFQAEADSGKDPKMHGFAQRTLPELQNNLRQFVGVSGLVPG